ncbi:MAG: LON peptidase substrate-binding domain-containing protein [Planctomycetota bacterium]|jgi:Lon protease-like protein
MAQAVRVNFGRPMPVFPLPEAVLLPHAIQPLHVIERRYRQLVNDCLDGAGQMALASFADEDWKSEYHELPSLRPAVCVGQIVQHEALTDGRHDILLQGICRARIVRTIDPDDVRTYRLVDLAPLEPVNKRPPPMRTIRHQLREMLNSPRLSRLRSVETVMGWFERDDVSTHALLELIGFTLLQDAELKYRLLAEASPVRRAGIIKQELSSLDDLVGRAELQPYRSWPKGMAWN